MAEPHVARVERIVAHAPDVHSLFLRLPPGRGVVFRPGQFLSLLLPVGDRTVTRAYSIASDPTEPELLEICLNRVTGGAGASAYLLDLAPGASIRFTGPWGAFLLDRAPAAAVVFIAADLGIVPIRPMLHRAAATATFPVTLLYGRTLPLWRDELAALPGVAVIDVAPGDLAAEAQRRWVDADGDRTRQFYLCGVGDLVLRLRDLLRGAGYARRAVQYERW